MASKLGLQFPVTGGIHLGGSATGAASTEAEICWSCHNAQGISEWGVNNNAMTGSMIYDYGSLSGNAASSGGWYSTVTSGSEAGATWTSAIAEFNYKSGAIQSTHSVSPDGTAVVTGSDYAKSETLDAVANIRCSYCHDVHDRNRALVDVASGVTETLTGQPYLRGSWRGNPYKEDGAPRAGMSGWTLQSGTTTEAATNYRDVPRASASTSNRMGGFWIDQNSGNPNSGQTLTTTAGLCSMCHGSDVDNMDQVTGENLWVSNSGSGNGHMNAVIGGSGTTSTAYNIFAISGRGSRTVTDDNGAERNPYMTMGGNGLARRGYSYRGIKDSSYGYSPQITDPSNDPGEHRAFELFAWGDTSTYEGASRSASISAGTVKLLQDDYDHDDQDDNAYDKTVPAITQSQYHTFNCGKCHNPHASRLPKLMITNCLDTKQNTWDSDSSLGMDLATLPPVPWQNTYASQWPTAQNCHRLSDATASDSARARGKGWNKVTPW
jgi:cytochrome c553